MSSVSLLAPLAVVAHRGRQCIEGSSGIAWRVARVAWVAHNGVVTHNGVGCGWHMGVQVVKGGGGSMREGSGSGSMREGSGGSTERAVAAGWRGQWGRWTHGKGGGGPWRGKGAQ